MIVRRLKPILAVSRNSNTTKIFQKRAMSATTTTNLPSSLTGPPICSLVPPGQCQLDKDLVKTKLLSRIPVSATSSVLRFQLPDVTKPLGLATCACVLFGCDTIHPDKNSGEMVMRPYTPISTNADIGTVDFLIKHYKKEGGLMSTYLHEIPEGDTAIQMRHVPFNVKIQAPFDKYDHIVMLVGGTGITPMIQALHAILGDASSKTKVTMLYGSRTADDILGSHLLHNWAATFPDRFQLVDILSDEPNDSDWQGERGFIDRARLETYIPKNAGRLIIFVCGPPQMYLVLCGPRDEPTKVKGILGEMEFGDDQVYKF